MAKKKRRRNGSTRSISYQAKDVFSKVMADLFKGESFAPFGIDLPMIVDAQSTNLPAVEANELRMDNLFYLEDDSYAIVDYESEYSVRSKLKYLGYLARVAKRLYNDNGRIPRIRLIVLYTADVKRGSTDPVIELGCGTITITEGFLSEMDGEAVWNKAAKDTAEGVSLDTEAIIKLMVYPLSFGSLKEKQEAVHRVISLVDNMADDKEKGFILSGMMVFGDKVIDPKDADEIRRRIMLTKVEKIIAREMQEAVDAAVEKTTAEVTRNVTEDVTNKVTDKIARNLLLNGDSVDKVASLTDIPIERVRMLQAAMG